jgi:DNA-binding IclR family transcriptional regulator
VLLATATAAERDRYLAGSLEATTPRSMTDRRRLRERFERVAKTGIEWVHEEFAEGINSVAAVVRDRGGAAVAAVHAHGPSYRFPGERPTDEIGKLLAATAERVSERIAW